MSVKMQPVNTITAGKVSAKREDYISWDTYFMGLALLTAKRSKDPVTQVGACIVGNDNKILSMGYNGFPRGCDDDVFPWGKTGDDEVEKKYFYVCHAELNAILNANSNNLKGSTIYVTLFPCNECTKALIQAGIKKIVYLSDKFHDKPATEASRRMLDYANVEYQKYEESGQRLEFTL
jgi:dCMP deaminase